MPTGGLHSFSTPAPAAAVESRAAAPPPGLPARPGVSDLRRARPRELVTATSEGGGLADPPQALSCSHPSLRTAQARLSFPGPPPALAEPRRSQRAMRARETLPEPPSPDLRLSQCAPQPEVTLPGLPPKSPQGKEGETSPYSPTVSSPSAVYLTVPPAYRAPPSWTRSTSPWREASPNDGDLRYEKEFLSGSLLRPELIARWPKSSAAPDGTSYLTYDDTN